MLGFVLLRINRPGASMETILTLLEVSELLRVHPATVYRLLKRGEIPAFKIGYDWRFTQGAIEMWIMERSKGLKSSGLRKADERHDHDALPISALDRGSLSAS